ncbi:reverse transcriptase domain-containing protein [Luteolibacter marinus]|uniref:reverse transcriptase domain-containing protein n=1 Tax=Luteolibacter marinus TaxID=2776705 RepID=UPI00186908A7|nr:reverse transcriptase domain-containing protein [Luteolibacter marinus]
MLEERIADCPLIRLIVKWLKAGVMDEGRVAHPATGTPQGGVISPVLANIYLHHVMDQWIAKVVSKHCRGRVLFRRYADDSVVCFEREEDARAYLRALPGRLAKFGLEMAAEKSALLRFDRRMPERSGKFTFLGFDFHWARARGNPDWVFVKRRTNKGKFRASLRAMKEWLRKVRCGKLADLLAVLRRKLRGYWNYYGVIGNSSMTAKYQSEVNRLLYKWLNRRSQRRSMTWTQFGRRLPGWDLPPPRVVEKPLTPALRLTRKATGSKPTNNRGPASHWLRVHRGARCGSSARRDLRGGRRAIGVPTSVPTSSRGAAFIDPKIARISGNWMISRIGGSGNQLIASGLFLLGAGCRQFESGRPDHFFFLPAGVPFGSLLPGSDFLNGGFSVGR